VQFILRVTNPGHSPAAPARRSARIDTATIMVLVGLQLLGTLLVVGWLHRRSELLPVLALALLNIVRLALSIFTWSIIIYVVLSWVSPGGYNPGAALVAAIVEPVLAPFRRLIPMIGGLDLSPLFALIAIQAVSMLLPIDRILGVMLCSPLSRSVF
jgi:YggT family protein